ncbi:MAG: glycine cleavage system aminomethyltransferase GcvT [Oscillospiraceae bacterium]|nr:glycine cleavage system aminomethyltransferase GcvT [Oscillospiraceae bacterium]
MERVTALYERHAMAGARMAPFAGYIMPISYPTGIIAEHNAVRTAAGLFDISHMGLILAEGRGALTYLRWLLCNDMAGLAQNGVRYSPILNESGGVIDDALVACLGANLYAIIVNASNIESDFTWMKRHRFGDTALYDISRDVAILAVQGPRAAAIMSVLADPDELPKRYYTFSPWISVAEVAAFVSRTGYTGEDGFEIFVHKPCVTQVWDALMDISGDFGMIPCGLGARDTLRLEAAMPLYGHEMTDSITPLEAGMGRFVTMDRGKGDFIGRAALEAKGKPERRRVGLRMTGRGIAREGCAVYSGDKQIGYVTSGTRLPSMGYAGALALVDTRHRAEGTELEVDIRGRRVTAQVVKLPFYSRSRETDKSSKITYEPSGYTLPHAQLHNYII